MPWGGFEVVRTIQEGGEADLFEVRRARMDGFVQRAVVKRLADAADPDARERFAREARLLALLSDPRVVRILDYGVEDEVPFQVLEWVDGQDLGALVREIGPLRARHAAAVIKDVASAVLSLHEARDADGQPLALTHNDLAPENVLLNVAGHVKLIDLGRVDDVASRPASWVHGRRPFLAPERLNEGASSLASDVFALGAMLGYLVVGFSPFEDAARQSDLLAGRSPKLPDLLPEPVAGLIRRACHPDPRRRFASMLDLQVALDEALERLPQPPASLRRWVEARRQGRPSSGVSAPPSVPLGDDESRTEVSDSDDGRKARMRGLFEVDVGVEAGPPPARSTILPFGQAEEAKAPDVSAPPVAASRRPPPVPPPDDPDSAPLVPRDPRLASVTYRTSTARTPSAFGGRWSLLAAIGKRGCGELFVALDRSVRAGQLRSGAGPAGVRLLKLFDAAAVSETLLERELAALVRVRAPALLRPLAHGQWGHRRFVVFDYLIGRALGRVLRDLRSRGTNLSLGFVQRIGLSVSEALLAVRQAREQVACADDLLLPPGSIFIGYDREVLLTNLAFATASERGVLGAQGGRWTSLTDVVWRLSAAGAPKSTLERRLRRLAHSTLDERSRLLQLQDVLRTGGQLSADLDMRALYEEEVNAEMAWIRGAAQAASPGPSPALAPPRQDLIPSRAGHPALSTIVEEPNSLVGDDPTVPFANVRR